MAEMDDDDDLRCPGCGGLWSLISRNHRCSGHLLKVKEVKSSGGGVEGHAGKLASVAVVHPAPAALPSDGGNSSGKTAPRARSTAKPEGVASVETGPPVAKGRRGRPPIEGDRPWDKEGVSRRTWYRMKERGDL
jgi:hypothetical protein